MIAGERGDLERKLAGLRYSIDCVRTQMHKQRREIEELRDELIAAMAGAANRVAAARVASSSFFMGFSPQPPIGVTQV